MDTRFDPLLCLRSVWPTASYFGPSMQNDEIAKVLDEIADMLEIGGENFFRVRAYRNAARAIHDTPPQLTDLPRDDLKKLPGIGTDLAGKLATLLDTGELPLHTELLRRFPAGFA
jgi:DNA polymerase (family 10)